MNTPALDILVSRTSLRLDPVAYALEDPIELQMLLAIAKATEKTRVALYRDPSWGVRIPMPPRGLMSPEKRQQGIVLADLLPWPALLTLRQCADEVAHQIEGGTRDGVLQYALSICPIEHWPTLLNYMALGEAGSSIAQALGPVIRNLKAKEARIKQGASLGGKKSGKERIRQSSVPEIQKLLQERQRLLESGRESKDVAGILALRYGVAPTTIRRKFRQVTEGDSV